MAPRSGQSDPVGADRMLEFLEVMRQLRVECGWKREQTHRSLSRYLLEETHETLEAIDTGDRTGDWGHLREELGDLLLQVYFHAVIAEEAGEFTLDDVAADIIDKMRRRNPHVFAPPGGERAPAGDAATINEVWESIKATEKSRSLRSRTASRRACPRCCTPTRCSIGSRGPAHPWPRIRVSPRGVRRSRLETSAIGCWRWWPKPGRPGWIPSRRCATPYAAPASDGYVADRGSAEELLALVDQQDRPRRSRRRRPPRSAPRSVRRLSPISRGRTPRFSWIKSIE